MKSSYPVHIKPYLKVGPAVMMSLVLMAAFPVFLFHLNYVRYETLPKPLAKSTNYERALRLRDEKYRHLYHKYLTEQPRDALFAPPKAI